MQIGRYGRSGKGRFVNSEASMEEFFKRKAPNFEFGALFDYFSWRLIEPQLAQQSVISDSSSQL